MVTNSPEYIREYMRKYTKSGKMYACTCGKMVKDYYKSVHKKSAAHKRNEAELMKQNDVKTLKAEIEELKQKLESNAILLASTVKE